MPRPKGSKNKLTTEVKEHLQNLIDTVVNRINVDSMTTDQKLKLLQLSIHYVLPKLLSTETIEAKQRFKFSPNAVKSKPFPPFFGLLPKKSLFYRNKMDSFP